MKKSLIMLLIIAAFGFYIFHLTREGEGSYAFDQEITIKNVRLSAAIVDSDIERAKGLSGHRKLANGEALLFIFERPDLYGIWMKDMMFPIDVIWFNEKMKVVSIRENFSPSSYPEVSYPASKAWYVLETSTGFVKDHNILIGDELKILR